MIIDSDPPLRSAARTEQEEFDFDQSEVDQTENKATGLGSSTSTKFTNSAVRLGTGRFSTINIPSKQSIDQLDEQLIQQNGMEGT